jgi:hypothetical protein
MPGKLWEQWDSLGNFHVTGTGIRMSPSIVSKGLATRSCVGDNPKRDILRHIPKTQLSQSSSKSCSDDYPELCDLGE